MPVVKKTVALHPIMDSAVRRLWAVLIEKGYDATYSTCLNALILGGWLGPTYMKKGGEEWDKFFATFNDFLQDEETVKEIDLEHVAAKFGKTVRSRVRQTRTVEVKTRTDVAVEGA
jgi:hypothetical protein